MEVMCLYLDPSKCCSLAKQKPKIGFTKINCDVAVGAQFSSIAAVARDWRGEMVFSNAKKVNTIIPLQAEAEAILWSCQLAQAHGIERLIIESDSKSSIEALCLSFDVIHWRLQNWAKLMQAILTDFPHWYGTWIGREANQAPHSLAKWSPQHCYWGSFGFLFWTPIFCKLVFWIKYYPSKNEYS